MTTIEKPSITRWSHQRPAEGDDALGHVLLTFRVYPDDGAFVGECAELDVSSFGADPLAALEATLEATELYLERLDANGERDAVLSKKDVKVYDYAPSEDFSVGLTAHPGELVSAQRFAVYPAS
jgi:predicted RNase H-like HicB family nuclease